MLKEYIAVVLICALFGWSFCLSISNLEEEMSRRHADYGYWYCNNRKWQKMFHPTYEMPRISCIEVERVKNATRACRRDSFGQSDEVCSQLCSNIGGIFSISSRRPRQNRCQFQPHFADTPCSDHGECEFRCILSNFEGISTYNNMTSKGRVEPYYLGVGVCTPVIASSGMQCSGHHGYFISCGSYLVS